MNKPQTINIKDKEVTQSTTNIHNLSLLDDASTLLMFSKSNQDDKQLAVATSLPPNMNVSTGRKNS